MARGLHLVVSTHQLEECPMRSQLITILAALPFFVACNSNEPNTPDDCGPEDDIERGADTAGQGLKTGVVAAGEGIDTFGSATVEFFKNGSDAAADEWDEEAAETRRKANEDAEDTRRAAIDDHCE